MYLFQKTLCSRIKYIFKQKNYQDWLQQDSKVGLPIRWLWLSVQAPQYENLTNYKNRSSPCATWTRLGGAVSNWGEYIWINKEISVWWLRKTQWSMKSTAILKILHILDSTNCKFHYTTTLWSKKINGLKLHSHIQAMQILART